MRIWYQHILPPTSELEPYFDLLRRDFRVAARPGTEIVIKSPQKGLTCTEHVLYNYFTFLNDRETMEGMLQAEKEGYDAVAIGCYADPCLHQAREVLNIPVVGPAESSMLLACLAGYRFAIVETHPKYVPGTESRVYAYGVRSRAITKDPVRPLTISPEELERGLKNPSRVIEDFEKVAKTCIDDGAEVIIPGCTILSPMLTQAGVRVIAGALILNCVIAEVKLAEVLVDLKKAGLPWISRKNLYASPVKKQIEQVRTLFPYIGSESS